MSEQSEFELRQKNRCSNVQNLLAVLTFCLLLCQDKRKKAGIKVLNLVQNRFVHHSVLATTLEIVFQEHFLLFYFYPSALPPCPFISSILRAKSMRSFIIASLLKRKIKQMLVCC